MSNKPIKLWQYLVPIVVLLAIWFYPVPEGLKPQAWHMFAIFVATIVGILCAPLPSGALMFIALALSIFTNTLSFKAALSGFASGTVWMIFSAYVLSLGFVQSGLGRRIAYKTLSLFGGSSLGIAYSLGIADLILAPAMPSVTARSGGIILPISAFVACGFEHCVANMFFLPTGLLLNSMGIGAEGEITMGGILFNLSAATLGNIVGGVLVGMAYWYIYAKRAK